MPHILDKLLSSRDLSVCEDVFEFEVYITIDPSNAVAAERSCMSLKVSPQFSSSIPHMAISP